MKYVITRTIGNRTWYYGMGRMTWHSRPEYASEFDSETLARRVIVARGLDVRGPRVKVEGVDISSEREAE